MKTELSYQELLKTSPYKPVKAKIVKTNKYTEFEKLFRIELDGKKDLEHVPGQFVQVSLFGVGEAPISVCSSPTEKGYFDLTVRRVGGLTTAMHKLETGSVLGIRGPFGKGFPLDAMRGNDILIVAGGLGIVPLRSLIHYILDQRKDFGDVQILLGCKTPKDMLFGEEVEAWQKRADIKFNCTVDRADPDWKGNVGLITSLIPGASIEPKKTYAVVVGPPIMYKFVIVELLKKEIPGHQIIVSLERKMKCGLGKCGHCQIRGVYVCQSGPVFTYDELRQMEGECHEGECHV
ncbi:NAD/FAD binding domain, oxidoreductase [Candidatus Velamenicoccus archaeovorus]|uniref:NAD/FAD binding domain, oxidoreductase n=1 Tax=Velamenicoccus archaeovorus TaxID=1930593 RepID=A0A410P602_VELA1|nr:FAD/NAD(P)-binding protein [Candidatus Velamenicoccus archaeovorus]QAT17626.1 NAD/FAD binding domain, oxidoreductase [Candidatus Velamenicoccus archaeovorus]